MLTLQCRVSTDATNGFIFNIIIQSSAYEVLNQNIMLKFNFHLSSM